MCAGEGEEGDGAVVAPEPLRDGVLRERGEDVGGDEAADLVFWDAEDLKIC
jgi:hypothetical protein